MTLDEVLVKMNRKLDAIEREYLAKCEADLIELDATPECLDEILDTYRRTFAAERSRLLLLVRALLSPTSRLEIGVRPSMYQSRRM